jgi:hypothetical protein
MRLISTVVIAACFAAANPAFATDFTFNVPVRISNLRFAESVEVTCEVSGPGFTNSRGTTTIGLMDSGYNGTVTVAFNSVHPLDAALANHYQCMLLVHYRRPDGGYGVFNFTDTFGSSRYTSQTGQAIASHAPEHGWTTGTLP